MKTSPHKSALRVFEVLKALAPHFANGLSPSELSRHLGYSAWEVTRALETLEQAGFAERMAENGRVRPSVLFGRLAMQTLQSITAAQKKLEELSARLNTPL